MQQRSWVRAPTFECAPSPAAVILACCRGFPGFPLPSPLWLFVVTLVAYPAPLFSPQVDPSPCPGPFLAQTPSSLFSPPRVPERSQSLLI